MASSHSDLGKVGKDAFELLDYFGRSRRPTARPPSTNVHYGYNTPPKKEMTLDSTQVAGEFGGVLYVSRSRFHRAQFYGSSYSASLFND